METIPAQRMNILRDEPMHEVNLTFAFGKTNEVLYLNIDGNGEPIQQFTIKFSDFENVVNTWLDGENDTEFIPEPSPAVRAICELHGDGRITDEEKTRLLAAL